MIPRRAVLAVGCLVALSVLAPAAAAQGSQGASVDGRLEAFEQPASSIQRDIKGLYDLILPISIVVGVLVEILLLYAIFRFRSRTARIQATEEHERGHTALEIAWTIPPAAILLAVGLLSTNVLGSIEEGPPADVKVDVIASQFSWTFRYPDGSTSANGTLMVEAGKVVNLTVTATDVIHSFAIPALGVKIDAIPGRVNDYWFRADIPGTYQVQCMEYCGSGHAYMRAAVVALPAGSTNGKGYVSAAAIDTCDKLAPGLAPVRVGMIEGADRWSVDPARLTLQANQAVCFAVDNPAGQAANHNMAIDDGSGRKVATMEPVQLLPGQVGALHVPAGLPAGAYTFYCAVPGHRQAGMEGPLTVS